MKAGKNASDCYCKEEGESAALLGIKYYVQGYVSRKSEFIRKTGRPSRIGVLSET